MTEILLIRHGETDWNVARRLQGHTDINLNAQGRRQAAALGAALRAEALDAIFASDLQRAVQTAQAVAQWQRAPLHLDAGLRERCYGAFEGLLHPEIQARFPQAYAAWQAREIDAVFPAGERESESYREFYQRVIASIFACAARYPGQKIALVAHGGVLECAYRAAQAMPLDAPRNFKVFNASINRFSIEQDKLRLLSWGEIAHLQSTVLDESDSRLTA